MMDRNGSTPVRKRWPEESRTSSRMNINKSQPSSKSRIPVKKDTTKKPVQHKPRSRRESAHCKIIRVEDVMKHPRSIPSFSSFMQTDSMIRNFSDSNDITQHTTTSQQEVQQYAIVAPKFSICAANFPNISNERSVCSISARSRQRTPVAEKISSPTSNCQFEAWQSHPSNETDSQTNGNHHPMSAENESSIQADPRDRAIIIITTPLTSTQENPRVAALGRSNTAQVQNMEHGRKHNEEMSIKSGRSPSTKPIALPNRNQTWKYDKCIPPTGVMVQKKDYRVCQSQKPSSRTYENIFYRRKSFCGSSGNGATQPTAPARSSNSNDHNNNNNLNDNVYGDDARFQQQAHYTKIVTETNYEEYEEEVSSSSSVDRNRRKSKESKQGSVGKGRTKKPKVTIDEKLDTRVISPTSSTSSCHSDAIHKKEDSHEDVKVARKSRSSSPDKRMILPKSKSSGQLLLSDSELDKVDSDAHDDDECSGMEKAIESNERRTSEICQTCKVYKDLLSQSEATQSYLTQMLVLKDKELEISSGRPGGKLPSWVHVLNNDENGTFTSTENPRAIHVPKFDLDEFIRKYFKNALFTKDLQDSPFTPLQLFHVALSARDCMAQVVKAKLRHAESILKQKYDILVNLKSSSTEPLDDSVYFAVLDSYRRFVRFIYFYFKDSIKRVKNFEQTYISQQRNSSTSPTSATDEPQNGAVYSHEQVVTINGEKYTAVVIPIRKLGPEGDACDRSVV